MPQVYKVKAPDGSIIKVQGPEGASQEEVISQAKRLYSQKGQASPEAPQATPAKEEPGFWDSFSFGFDAGRGITQLASEKGGRATAPIDPEKRTPEKFNIGRAMLPGSTMQGFPELIGNMRFATKDERAANEAKAKAERDEKLAADHPEVFNNEKARTGAGALTGRIARTILDPTTLLGPASGAGLKGVMATNAAIAGADSAGVQALETGEVDPKQVLLAAAAAAAIGPAAKGLGKAGSGIKKLVKRPDVNTRIKDGLIEGQARTKIYSDMGLNEVEATSRAVKDMGRKLNPVRDSADYGQKEMVDILKGPSLKDADFADTTNAVNKRIHELTKSGTSLDKFQKKLSKQVNQEAKRLQPDNPWNYIRSAYDAMSMVSNKMANRLRKYEYVVARRISDVVTDKPGGLGLMSATKLAGKNTASRKAWTAFQKTNPEDSKKLKMAMFNGNQEDLSKLLPVLPGAVRATINTWRKIRGNYKERITQSGHVIDDWVDEYFPRSFKSPGALREHFLRRGLPSDKIQGSVEDVTRIFGGDPDMLVMDKRIAALNKAVKQAEIPGQVRTGPTSQMKTRIQNVIDEKDLNLLRDPFDTMVKYVHDVESNLAKRELFGLDPNQLDKSLGATLEGAVTRGEMTAREVPIARHILQARFVNGERSMAPRARDARNIANMATLGTFRSAMVQLGDIAVGVAYNGALPTMKGIMRALGHKNAFTHLDLGIMDITAEFTDGGKTGDILDKLLRTTGFKHMDAFGKRTNINGALAKLQSQARKGPKKIDERFKDAMTPGERAKLYLDLQKPTAQLVKEQDDNVRYALFSEISNMQPVSLSELPVKYLEMRNGRLWYQLRSFGIKQMELVRREFTRKLRTDPKAAAAFGLRYITAMTAISGSVDFAANALMGKYKDENIDSLDEAGAEIFKEGIENSVAAAIGLNRFAYDRIARGDITGAVAASFMPPVVSVPGRIVEGVAKGREDIYGRYVPHVGLFAPYLKDDK